MNIGVCASNYVGYELLRFMGQEERKISFVIGNEKDEGYRDKIKDFCYYSNIEYFCGIDINGKEFVLYLKSLNIDILFLLWYPTILKQRVIEYMKIGVINLHPSYIPYSRGRNYWFWDIVEDSPSGVTIHFIDDKIDRGQILFQQKIQKDITTNGEQLYNKCAETMIDLFCRQYKNILEGKYTLTLVDTSHGTFHYAKELDQHSEIKLDKEYKAVDFFYKDGKKYQVSIKIEEEVNE